MLSFNLHPHAAELVARLSDQPETMGVLLSGSYAASTSDADSDYDFYIYTSSPISVEKRREITKDLFGYIELDNRYWETEDDGRLLDGDMPVDIVYRDLNWLKTSIEDKIFRYQADAGYTTCIWANFIASVILFDREGRIGELKRKYDVAYPPGLRKNIIEKNYGLLKQRMPAYYSQIEKAVRRGDAVSVNHRVAAFFASYFDILFAVNEIPHPGEKKIMRLLKERCVKLPADYESNIRDILALSGTVSTEILPALDTLIGNLDTLLEQAG